MKRIVIASIGVVLLIVIASFLYLWLTFPKFEKYGSLEEFRSDLLGRGVVGKQASTVYQELNDDGFFCKKNRCTKSLPGFPCNQKLGVFFKVGKKGIISGFNLLQKKGGFVTACL